MSKTLQAMPCAWQAVWQSDAGALMTQLFAGGAACVHMGAAGLNECTSFVQSQCKALASSG